jgi:hypothetical protein
MSLHTDIPGRDEVERLLEQRADGLVSIYLPTSTITPDADVARIAFMNLSGQAIEELRDRDPRPRGDRGGARRPPPRRGVLDGAVA